MNENAVMNDILFGMVVSMFCLLGGIFTFISNRVIYALFLFGASAVASFYPVITHHLANPGHITTFSGLALTGMFGGLALVVCECITKKKSVEHTFPWSVRIGAGMVLLAGAYVITKTFIYAVNNPLPRI